MGKLATDLNGKEGKKYPEIPKTGWESISFSSLLSLLLPNLRSAPLMLVGGEASNRSEAK